MLYKVKPISYKRGKTERPANASAHLYTVGHRIVDYERDSNINTESQVLLQVSLKIRSVTVTKKKKEK